MKERPCHCKRYYEAERSSSFPNGATPAATHADQRGTKTSVAAARDRAIRKTIARQVPGLTPVSEKKSGARCRFRTCDPCRVKIEIVPETRVLLCRPLHTGAMQTHEKTESVTVKCYRRREAIWSQTNVREWRDEDVAPSRIHVAPTSAKIRAVSSCSSNMWRNLSKVVASGTGSTLKSMPAKVRIA